MTNLFLLSHPGPPSCQGDRDWKESRALREGKSGTKGPRSDQRQGPFRWSRMGTGLLGKKSKRWGKQQLEAPTRDSYISRIPAQRRSRPRSRVPGFRSNPRRRKRGGMSRSHCCYFKPQVMEASLKRWLTARSWIRCPLSGRMQAGDRDKVQPSVNKGYIFEHHLVAFGNTVLRSIVWGESLSF